MFTINDKNLSITLKAILKNEIKNELILKEVGQTTLISEENTIYICVEKNMNLNSLKDNLEIFSSNSKYDFNVELDSFLVIGNKEEIAQLVIETIMFGAHKQIEFKLKEKTARKVNFIVSDDLKDVYTQSAIKMEYVNFARDLQDLPPNIGTSVEIANRIEQKAKSIDGLKVTVYNKKQIEEMGMGLLLSVNAGSHIEPRVVVLEYNSDSSQKRTALVGKGITFDSGGYNLKPSNFIENMKFDMSGAAIVSSTVMALAQAKVKCNVVSVAMLTDNRIGGHATLTESVIKSMNGQTVEITNTDAEGRLVLADGITYALRNEKADRAITVATLTGAIRFALGHWFTGMFTKQDEFSNEFMGSAKVAQETVWRLPLIEEHLKAMKCSKVADLANSEPGREAGSSTAAGFLESFAEGKDYLHLDIASTADINKRGRAPMLRTLFELLNK